MSVRLFISYRRRRKAEVVAAKVILEAAGVDVWLDLEDIDPLADFPQRIRECIDGSHAVLVWLSVDYAESDICMQEFRLAWQHARRLLSDVARRVWLLNPESGGEHIFAGELNASNFLTPPPGDTASEWANSLNRRLDALLHEGPLADERDALPVPALHGTPTASARFTGRGAELMRIHSALFPPQVGASAAGVAVQTHGMGGIGKTELAAKYVQDFAHAYPAGVFWLNLAAWTPPTPATEADAETAWLRAMDQTLQHHPGLWEKIALDPDGRILPASTVRERLSKQLAGDDPTLFVLDNLPQLTPLDVRQRILAFVSAPGANGKTLITTRDARSIDGFTPLPLDVLGAEDALRLLVRHIPEPQRKTRQADERDAMEALIHEVGGHTLALSLLGERYGGEPDGYLIALEDVRAHGQLQRIDAIAGDLREEIGERARGIVATFAVSIEPLPEDIQQLLSLASVCAPNTPIPDAMLALAFDGETSDDFSRALRALLRGSLLTRREDATALEIHPLIAETSCALLRPDLGALRKRIAAALLRRTVVLDGDASKARELTADAAQAAHLAPHLADQDGVHLYFRLGQYESSRGQLHQARPAHTSALELAIEVLGAEHRDTLNSMTSLANTLHALGELAEARKLHEQALQISQRKLGAEHPDTLISMTNLAGTLHAQGELTKARNLNEEALDIRGRVLGEEHPDTLTSMDNLAETLGSLGVLAGARKLQKQALDIRGRVLGEEHPKTLRSMDSLAGALRAQGELCEARKLYERIVKIHQRALGREHVDTSVSAWNLFSVLSKMGDTHGALIVRAELLAWLAHHPPDELDAHQRTIRGYVRQVTGLDPDTPPAA